MDMRIHKIPRPKDIKDFILDNTAKTLLIGNHKTGEYYCSKKRKKVEPVFMDVSPNHNRSVWTSCNFCDRNCYAKYKEQKYSRMNEAVRGRIVWFAKKGKSTYVQVDRYLVIYTNFMPEVILAEGEQFKLSKEECKAAKMEYNFSTGRYDTYEKKVSINISKSNMHYGYDEFLIYNKDGKVSVGSDLKYANMEDKVRREDINIIRYLYYFLKYQSIELLEKAGFENIIKDRYVRDIGSRCINWRAKNLQHILKMSKMEVRESKRFNINDIEIYHKLKGLWPEITSEIFIKSESYIGAYYYVLQKEGIEELAKNIKFEKLIEYIKSQKEERVYINLGIYLDYFNDIKLCGEITKQNLRPKDFQKAHEEFSDKAFILKNEINAKNFKTQSEILGRGLEYENKELNIKIASSVDELVKESSELNHCVKTYVDRMAKGNTAIFFIRKKEALNESYFTLELSPRTGEIIQCRGKRNCSYGDDVKLFLKEWKKVIKKEMNRRKKEDERIRKCS